jgi:hypothetical protein
MNSSRNLWPVGIIVACALFVAGTAALIVFACTQRVELVSHDYYERELKFQGQIDRAEHTRRAASQASIAYDPAGKCITVSLPAAQARQQVWGSVELYRPSAAGMDRAIRFEPDANGIQRVDATGLAPGLWRVRVSWTAEKENYYLEQKVVVAPKAS